MSADPASVSYSNVYHLRVDQARELKGRGLLESAQIEATLAQAAATMYLAETIYEKE